MFSFRTGAISPELVCIINQQFSDIDTESKGSVTYEEITNVHIPALIIAQQQLKDKSVEGDNASSVDERLSRPHAGKVNRKWNLLGERRHDHYVTTEVRREEP